MGRKLIDELGNKYGRLTVIEEAGRNKQGAALWLCECECGNKIVTRGNRLRRGASKSCGCTRWQLIDEIGNRHGRLVVMARAENDKTRHARWLCRCDCGNEVVVTATALRSGHTSSCGCLNKEIVGDLCRKRALRMPKGETGLNELYGTYKRDARGRGLVFDLTKKRFRQITSELCYYCGTPPSQTRNTGHARYTYNGIDRMDNGVGYIISNAVPCCKHCNAAKSTMTIKDFLEWIARVYDYSVRESGVSAADV